MRHVTVGMMRVQQKQDTGELKFKKVDGEQNPGDLMTKYLSQKVVDKLMKVINMEFKEGRADSGLKVSKTS